MSQNEKRTPQDVLESIEAKLGEMHHTMRDLANITMLTAFASALQIIALAFAVWVWWRAG